MAKAQPHITRSQAAPLVKVSGPEVMYKDVLDVLHLRRGDEGIAVRGHMEGSLCCAQANKGSECQGTCGCSYHSPLTAAVTAGCVRIIQDLGRATACRTSLPPALNQPPDDLPSRGIDQTQ